MSANPNPSSPEATPLAALLERWLDQCTFPEPGSSLDCAVSGGTDSLALLALAVASGLEVTAIHVDHGQRTGSDSEADTVATAAATLGADFRAERVDVQAGSNIEARMRAARYGVLGTNVATGHTLDDQAETMLINLLRGAGLPGLGAMQPGVRRPILSLRRADTAAICDALGWTPISDPSNSDPSFVRNRVRHELIPLLDDISERDIAPILARTSGHLRSAHDALDELARSIDPTDARAVAAAPAAVAALALSQWIRSQTGSEHPVDTASLVRVLEVARGDRVAAEIVGGHRISRSAQRLRLG
ncbi:MAG: tRNA lysidine(34) synthetase TilS [Acidimicrobiales bacterium]